MNRDNTSPGPPPDGAASVGSLISGVVADLQGIVHNEIQLAKTELTESAKKAAVSAALLGVAAVFGLVGFWLLMLAVGYVIAIWLDVWAGIGIIALFLLFLAGILALAGKHGLSTTQLKPDQTIESLKEDQSWASQQINSVKR